MAIFLEVAELDARKIAAEAALAQLESHQRTHPSERLGEGKRGRPQARALTERDLPLEGAHLHRQRSLR